MTESLHLVLGLPTGLLPLISTISACIIIWPSANILHTCPNHSSMLLFIYERIYALNISSYISLLFLLLNCSVSLLYKGVMLRILQKYQMKINTNTTKTIVVRKVKKISLLKLEIDNNLIAQVKQLKYLKSALTSNGKGSVEIRL